MRKLLVAAFLALTATVTPATAQERDVPAGQWVIRADVSAHPYYNWWDLGLYNTVEQCESALANDEAFKADAVDFAAYERASHGPDTVVTFYCWTPGADPGKEI